MPSHRRKCQESEFCHLCGQVLDKRHPNIRNEQLKKTADHVKPKAHGGDHTRDNLLPAHRYCNEKRGDRPVTNELREELRTAVLQKYGFLIGDLERGLRKRAWWAA